MRHGRVLETPFVDPSRCGTVHFYAASCWLPICMDIVAQGCYVVRPGDCVAHAPAREDTRPQNRCLLPFDYQSGTTSLLAHLRAKMQDALRV